MRTGNHGRSKNSVERPYSQIYRLLTAHMVPGKTVCNAAMHSVKGNIIIVQQTKIALMAMFDTILLIRLDGSFIAQGLDECINVPKGLNFYQGLFVL